MHLTDDTWRRVLSAAKGNLRPLADELGVNYDSLRRERSERRRDQELRDLLGAWDSDTAPTTSQEARRATDRVNPYRGMPQPVDLLSVPPMQIDLDTFVYAADLHAPLHCTDTLERLVRAAEDRRIDVLIIGGDLFDFDSVSSHGRAEAQAGLQRTLSSGGALLDWLCDYFARIYVLPGNHDRRVAKRLDEPLSFEMLVRAGVKRARVSSDGDDAAEIVTTDNEYIYIGPEESGWVAGHPMRYSRTPIKLSAAAMRERRSLLLSHTHLQSFVWSDDGRYRIIEPGHCTDPKATPYLMRNQGLSTFATWKPGFVIVEQNKPTLYGEGLPQW